MKPSLILGLLVLLPPACSLEKSSLGEAPEDSDSDGATSTSSTDATSDASNSTADPTIGDASASVGGAESDVGAPCVLSSFPQSRMFDSGNPGCAASICLYANDNQPSVGPCATDDDCVTPGDTESYAVCNPETSECMLNPEFVAERSMCTDYCDTDSDCAGVDGTACESGFVCRVAATLGPDCCEKVCVCEDDASVDLDQATQDCAQGVAPGCCDQEPVSPACGQ